MITDPDAELSPLFNIFTNEPIEGFPGTPEQIGWLSGEDALFRDLH